MAQGLKSLELQGYKTFANRTVFEFSDNITAIVGPNGSGKSNIADSIRWVLGEQSYNVLRGRKTEDMIFSGSEKRSRSGMASATITFDNSTSWLPIEFSEVAITRRAYRDGQNEYLINGKRTRLKDVSELLSQSGLAERTYTIIGQGLVDAALSLKAEERRRLFEEAAGIGLYRSRREEAIRRLDTTRRNLDRVQDILLELEPRLKSLERQAKRAKEYEQVKADLQIVLREWYGYHWNALQEDYAKVLINANAQEKILKEVNSSQQNIDSTSLIEQERIFSFRKEINILHKTSAEYHTESQSISRNLAIIDERLANLQSQEQVYKADLIRLEIDLGDAYNQEESLQLDLTDKQQILSDSKSQLDENRERLNLLVLDHQKREKEGLQLKNEVEVLYLDKGSLQAKFQELSTQLQQYVKKKESLEHKKIGLENEKNKLGEFLFKLNKSLEAKKDLLAQSELKINGLESKLEQYRDRINNLKTDLIRLEEEKSGLVSRINFLEDADQRFLGYSAGAKILLEDLSKSENQEIIGSINQFIALPEYLEPAITAALGEFMDAVIVRDEGVKSLALLINNQVRGILLPIGLVRSNPVEIFSDHLNQAGVLGVGFDFVDVPKELSNIYNFLLGDALLVEDREVAKKIIQRIHKKNTLSNEDKLYSLRVITLSGEVFYISGPIITTSKLVDADNSSLLSRTRKRQEYQDKFLDVKSSIHTAQQNIEQVIPVETKLIEEITDNRKELQVIKSEYDSLVIEVNEVKIALDKVIDQLEFYSQEYIISDKLTLGLSHGISNLETDLMGLENKLLKKQQDYKDFQLSESVLNLEEQKNSVAYWEKVVALADQSKQEIHLRIADIKKIILSNSETINNLKHQLENLNQQIGSNFKEREIFRNKELEYENKIKEIQLEIDQAERHLDLLEKEQLQRQREQSESRKQLSRAEHQNAQARIELASKREAIESLRRRIEEDMGLVNLEYSESISGPTPLPLDGYVKDLPIVKTLSPDIETTLNRHRALLRRIGPINPEALVEYHEVKERFEFLSEQLDDLQLAENDIRQVIDELDSLMEQEFTKTFMEVASEFSEIFGKLFNGGTAQLLLTDAENFNIAGIDIEARLPGRRPQRLSLLSGGERSLTATALIFALLKVSPTPFCLLDEVDAMLDEANLDRFREMLSELSCNTQFVVVTHNRNTVQAADIIYGVTMGRDSSSQVVSLKPGEFINSA